MMITAYMHSPIFTHLAPLCTLPSLPTAFGLCGVIVIGVISYRLYFHPLKNIPGPMFAKISIWYSVYHAYRGDRHLALYHAHQRYGSIVRFGPNFVSFDTASAASAIYGHGDTSKKLVKSDFYNAFTVENGVHNTHNSISKTEHARRRRLLGPALSDSALKEMEKVVLSNIDVFMKVIRESASNGDAIDMGELCSWLAFDTMGEVALGRSFEMLTSDSQRFIPHLMDQGAYYVNVCGTYPLLHSLGIGRLLFPKLAEKRRRYVDYCRAHASERLAMGANSKRDVLAYLMEAIDSKSGTAFSIKELLAEAHLLIIAGSDLTASVLAALLYYLCRSPEAMKALQYEIRSHFQRADDIINGDQLAKCQYLRACVDEALRLAPAVPGILPRKVIEGPCIIDDVSIPDGCDISSSVYTLHHNPLYFDDPFQFKPERWLSGSVETERAAFTPFSMGPRNCLGKGVAYMQLRLTVARLLWEFDAEERETPGKGAEWLEGFSIVEGEYKLMDHFACKKEGPVIAFTRCHSG